MPSFGLILIATTYFKLPSRTGMIGLFQSMLSRTVTQKIEGKLARQIINRSNAMPARISNPVYEYFFTYLHNYFAFFSYKKPTSSSESVQEKTLEAGQMSGGVEPMVRRSSTSLANGKKSGEMLFFRMPLHFPRYSKGDYETMPEWQLDCLLAEYGLPVVGDVGHKRRFAMGAFLWSGLD
ncbi:hypothetical protein Cni_G10856 [Canna indica]|uniref:DUF7722 domain-containing protein n=1 Tax=Canna indica TaxID=4628 RepID=A0AAQ3K4Z5_9LILI|nr:hypothetical protein Cni_G10856 [Canna indica]